MSPPLGRDAGHNCRRCVTCACDNRFKLLEMTRALCKAHAGCLGEGHVACLAAMLFSESPLATLPPFPACADVLGAPAW